MQKIVIQRFGPIDYCELELRDFTVFTGPQASGKSTVAKSVFFFKNVKNILLEQFQKMYMFQAAQIVGRRNLSFQQRVERGIRANFLQTFGTVSHMEPQMQLIYYYKDDTFIKISLEGNPTPSSYVRIKFSDNFASLIELLGCRKPLSRGAVYDVSEIKERINSFLQDEAEMIYIPAGRSMITLLGTQLSYIYSSMDDTQKRNLDYCTQNYLERILQLKSSFTSGIDQMIQDMIHLSDLKVDEYLLREAAQLMKDILQGEYRNIDGEERLMVSDGQYIKINFASSGQQEVVWILNVIFYSLLNNSRSYFIIEEPESHLFPNAQKLIAEFISMAQNRGRNQMFITTHSPYMLGAINNLLYANRISGIVDQTELGKIVSRDKWLDFDRMSAYFVNHGHVVPCTDHGFGEIEHEVIDGASEDINRDYERMVLLKEKYQNGAERKER